MCCPMANRIEHDNEESALHSGLPVPVVSMKACITGSQQSDSSSGVDTGPLVPLLLMA